MASIRDGSLTRAGTRHSAPVRQPPQHFQEVLPQSASLVAAFPAVNSRGHPGQLVIDVGHELAVQHQEQWSAEDASRAGGAAAETVATCKRRIDDLNARRVLLVERIDDWVTREIRSQPGAPLHTETIGSVIDRIAIAWVRVNCLRDVGASDRARLALRQLTELAAAYDDLVSDVALGHRRLPSWRSLKSYRGDCGVA